MTGDQRGFWQRLFGGGEGAPPPPPPAWQEPSEEDLLAWLQQAGPAEWHCCAATWNWDQDLATLRWIIAQPDCDAGTAITLFARGEPSYYAQYPTMAALEADSGYMMDTVRFLIEICERWQAGQYVTYRFRPDQLPYVTPSTMPWPVPESLGLAEAQGEPLDCDGWNEGFPPQLLEGG